MPARERDVDIGGVSLRVRDAGDPGGFPVLHFHGTPGSRLELAWADVIVASSGVRLISFDRPGYGRSTPAPFSLSSVAQLALAVADVVGLDRFATTGLSGGGPFALATAGLGGRRVRAVGMMAAPGPFRLVPGAIESLSDSDRRAERLLPDDPGGAAAVFAEGFDLAPSLVDRLALSDGFGPKLCDFDRRLVEDPLYGEALLDELREALRQGVTGCAWDNVAWIGDWDFDPALVSCPVLLWYGTDDIFAPPAHAHWLEQNVPGAHLTIRPGEGHFAVMIHLRHMLAELQAAASGGELLA